MSHNLVQLRLRHAGVATTDNALSRLKAVMHDKREITAEDVRAIARAVGQPEAIVHGVATYYGDLGTTKRGRTRVKVCKGTACFAACNDASVDWMKDALGLELDETSPDGAVSLEAVYCLGLCNAGPSVEVEGRVYGELTPDKARALAADLAGGGGLRSAGELVPRFEAHGGPAIVLERLARPNDATSLEIAREHGAFDGLAKALGSMTGEQVLAEVERSGLRGRGGAGFSTGTKWRLTAQHARGADEAFVVCNADEGDPGSYIDKHLMERDPFAVIEGMALAAYAVGATHGYIYVRSEYPESAPALERAVRAARAAGLLGERLLGSDFSFDVDVVEGAGSYVVRRGDGAPALARRAARHGHGAAAVSGREGALRAADGRQQRRDARERRLDRRDTAASRTRSSGTARAEARRSSRSTSASCAPACTRCRSGCRCARSLEDIGGGLEGGRPIKAVQVGGPLGGRPPEPPARHAARLRGARRGRRAPRARRDRRLGRRRGRARHRDPPLRILRRASPAASASRAGSAGVAGSSS